MSKIINLTPHPLVIMKDGEVMEEIPSSGIVRVREEKVKIGELHGVPIYKINYTESEGLPSPKPDTYYFVSVIVANANPERTDLLLSSDLVRDDKGRILGCGSFATLNSGGD